MQLSKIALLAIKGCGKEAKKRLQDALDVSDATLYRYINENDDNLTKADALRVIREETGLKDSEILEERELEGSTK